MKLSKPFMKEQGFKRKESGNINRLKWRSNRSVSNLLGLIHPITNLASFVELLWTICLWTQQRILFVDQFDFAHAVVNDVMSVWALFDSSLEQLKVMLPGMFTGVFIMIFSKWALLPSIFSVGFEKNPNKTISKRCHLGWSDQFELFPTLSLIVSVRSM